MGYPGFPHPSPPTARSLSRCSPAPIGTISTRTRPLLGCVRPRGNPWVCWLNPTLLLTLCPSSCCSRDSDWVPGDLCQWAAAGLCAVEATGPGTGVTCQRKKSAGNRHDTVRPDSTLTRPASCRYLCVGRWTIPKASACGIACLCGVACPALDAPRC